MRILKGNEWRYLTTVSGGAFLFEELTDTSNHPSQIMVWEAKFIIHDGEGNDYVLYLSSKKVGNCWARTVTYSRSTRRRMISGEIPNLTEQPTRLLRANGIVKEPCSDGPSTIRRQHM